MFTLPCAISVDNGRKRAYDVPMDMSFQELAQDIEDAGSGRVEVPTSRPQVAKLRYTHEAMVDLIITVPGISQNQLAAIFGFTAAWVSNVIASDVFQAKLAERRAELIDPALIATIEERFKGLVVQSLDVLQQKLAKPQVSDTLALKALELGAKALGVGGNAAPAAVPVDLSLLRDRLLALKGEVHGQRGEMKTVEGEVLPEEQ